MSPLSQRAASTSCERRTLSALYLARKPTLSHSSRMLDAVIPLGALALLLIFVAQVRRLISHAILNGTIRRALEVDLESARLLIEKLDPRPRWPDALAGWIMVVAGLALGAAAMFASPDERTEALQLAAISFMMGAGILAYAWWVERATPRP